MPPHADPPDLQPFRTWLLENGRSEGTARLYALNVASCLKDDAGKTARLISRKLAPKTRHANRAALLAYARFTEDAEFEKRLKAVRLPPSDRTKVRPELDRAAWAALIDAIAAAKRYSRPKKAVLLIICMRGLRCSDVLRLRRPDVLHAIRSGTLIGETKGGKRIEWKAEAFRDQLEVLASYPDWDQVTDLVVPTSLQTDEYKRRHNAVTVLGRVITRIAKKVEIDGVHPHRLRHTYATHFVDLFSGDPRAIVKLQKHMGWSNLATAAIYVDAVSHEELDTAGQTLIADLRGSMKPDPAPEPRRRRRR